MKILNDIEVQTPVGGYGLNLDSEYLGPPIKGGGKGDDDFSHDDLYLGPPIKVPPSLGG